MIIRFLFSNISQHYILYKFIYLCMFSKFYQTDGMIMDNYGYLYFGLLRNHAICRWDSYRPFTYDNQQIIAKDDTHIQWTDGKLKIIFVYQYLQVI